MQAGAEVRVCHDMVHAKLVIVDNSVALCGSDNLDGRSLFLNYEAMTAFYSAPEIDWLQQWSDALAGNNPSHQPKPPSWWRDVAEGLVRSVAFQL